MIICLVPTLLRQMPEYLKRSPMYSQQVTEDVRRTVSEMLLRIEREGEKAIRRYSRELDGWDPPSLLVEQAAVQAAEASLTDELREHIAFAQRQVRAFAVAQLVTLTELEVETQPGIVLGHRHIPVGRVGSYVPGGRYPMLASSFMTVIVPKVAGVQRVVACAPPRHGAGIEPAMLYAIATSGADRILCLGGVQALAAMAFGIEDLEPADMIVGAGNAYVAEAKRQLFGRVGIDLLAGPTEIVVIADEHADPELVAADLLGQAEHGPTSPAVLITTSDALGRAVLDEVGRLLETWPTREVAGAAWEAHGSVIVVKDRDEAVATSDEIAPEHLEVQVAQEDQDWYLRALHNYGSLFLGEQATVAYGDKGVGTNHVLPTMGAARYTGGLWVGKFLKTCTYQRLTEEGTKRIAPTIAAICEAEHFGGHALTATMRLERLAERAGSTN
jgi:sulfopropanediol 3-dehydrogenase